ncbi:nostrin-like isoform X2 [Acanthaster planci]|uniref:Nostrin-like isoform X2 n=1 Tax=Acanthaster planci TaxID=133434 RepID=A0A8B7XGJ3_ACAPL|nr:nostrin-like isoform X2 [Acanthaster planci]
MEFKEVFTDETGYAELKKHMRQATDFSSSVMSIFQERAEIESTYAKSIAKLNAKALKCNKDATGSLMAAWNIFCGHLNNEAEHHKVSAECLHEDIYKRLKTYFDMHMKARKTAEANVDKACKAWHDKRAEMVKAKKVTHSKTKESEGMQAILEDPTAKGKVLSDKELGKLQSKSRKADEAASKADMDYLNLTKATERARHEFEKVLRQAVTTLEKLEKERIGQQKEVMLSYSACLSKMLEPLQKDISEMTHAVTCINPDTDVMAIAQHKSRHGEHVSQVLYDPYEEDLSNSMTLNRRRQSLHSKLQALDSEIQKETKVKAGIARLSGAYADNPSYADANAKEDVVQQMGHSEEMINMLRASKFKIMAAIALMDKKPKPSDDISSFIKTEKDKHQGVNVSVLKMPRPTAPMSSVSEVDGRGMADGAHNLPLSPSDSNSVNSFDGEQVRPVIGQCMAKFDYEAQEPEEISLKEGDVINVIQKFDDGWWFGEIGGQRGNFPGSYVDLL